MTSPHSITRKARSGLARSLGPSALAMALLTAAILLSAQLALAQPSAPAARQASAEQANVDPQPAGEPTQTAVQALDLAQRLFALALAREDAVLALTAARVTASIGVRAIDLPATVEGGVPSTKTESTGVPDAAEMMRVARTLASGNAALLALADATEERASRGRTIGPARAMLRVDGRASMALFSRETEFRAGELAEVAISGDGDTDLDLFVYDEHGIEICRSTGPKDREYCSWRPRWTGRFRIVVHNLGPMWNQFVLVTN